MALGVLGARGKKRGIILPEGLGTVTKRRQLIWVLKDPESQQQERGEACPGLREPPSLWATHAHFSSSALQDLKELSHPCAGELSPGWRGVWWELSQSLTCGCCRGLECHRHSRLCEGSLKIRAGRTLRGWSAPWFPN